MAPPSRMNKESDARAPLSSRMLDLLALIITAIDLRELADVFLVRCLIRTLGRDIIDVPPEPGYSTSSLYLIFSVNSGFA